MARQKLDQEGDSFFIYVLILGLIVLFFVGIKSCARGGFPTRMEEMSDNFISRQQVDERAAGRMPDNRPLIERFNVSDTRNPDNVPASGTVSEDTAQSIREHSLTLPEPKDK